MSLHIGSKGSCNLSRHIHTCKRKSSSTCIPQVPVTHIGLCGSSARCSVPVQKHLHFLLLQPLLGMKAFQPMLVNAVTRQRDRPRQTEERWESRVRLERAAGRKAAVLSLSRRWIIWCWGGPWCASKSRKTEFVLVALQRWNDNTRLHTKTWQQQVAIPFFGFLPQKHSHSCLIALVDKSLLLFKWTEHQKTPVSLGKEVQCQVVLSKILPGIFFLGSRLCRKALWSSEPLALPSLHPDKQCAA